MGKLFAGILVLLFIIGAFLVFASTREFDDKKQVNEYIESNGATPIPPSWKNKIGKGI